MKKRERKTLSCVIFNIVFFKSKHTKRKKRKGTKRRKRKKIKGRRKKRKER